MSAFKLFLKSLAGTTLFLVILFLSAGKLNYWQGLLYAGLNILMLLLNSLALADRRELAEERSKTATDTKKWDKVILGLSALTLVFTYITAGLDAGRFHWSPGLHPAYCAAGILLLFAGEAAFLAAQRQNRFFSSVMRIQADRGHTVCDTGLYRVVRHPSYTGMILTAIGIPLILGSLWSLIPALLSILLTVIRTAFEDRTLKQELEGYKAYSLKTRFRLIPYIW